MDYLKKSKIHKSLVVIRTSTGLLLLLCISLPVNSCLSQYYPKNLPEEKTFIFNLKASFLPWRTFASVHPQ